MSDDPIASHSAQFGLARPAGTPVGHDARLDAWRYDHAQQVAVTLDGARVSDIVAADPTANSVSDLDGDEG